MAGLADFRQQHPEYNDMSDRALADALHAKFYSDMPKTAFDTKMGLAQAPAPAPAATPQPRTFGQKLGDEFAGLKQSLYDIPQSVAELGARGTDAIGLTNDAYSTIHGAFNEGNNDAATIAGADPKSGFYTGGRVAGNIATTLPLSELKIAQMAGKLPTLARVADGAVQGATAAGLTSNSSDAPLSQQLTLGAAGGAALPVLGGVAKVGLGKVLPSILGDISTGAGGTSVKEAFKAGLAGGDAGAAFTDSMRGNTPWETVVTQAKDALGQMRQARNAAYRSGMSDISKDATVLSFEPIDKTMADASKIKVYRGRSGTAPAQNLSKSTGVVQQEVADALDHWKGLDPAEFHTPEGFDALKQQLGDIRDQYDFNTPQRLVAENAYNAVKKTIAEQAPAYDKVMADYSKASEAVSDIQKELSLGKKGNPATALRKLQSVMRNNANTSWGDRASKVETLADNGAPNLMPALAGQALSPIVPRGLARWADVGLAATGGLTNPMTLAALPLASPRMVGELAYGAGSAARGFKNGADALGFQLPRLKPLGSFQSPALGVLTPKTAH